jgi:hypothetical protein
LRENAKRLQGKYPLTLKIVRIRSRFLSRFASAVVLRTEENKRNEVARIRKAKRYIPVSSKIKKEQVIKKIACSFLNKNRPPQAAGY